MQNETMVTLQGWVGGEVTLRRAGEVPVTSFRVACTPRRFSRRTEQWSDGPTQWYTISAWRALGEHCAASLRRGDAVVVHGRVNMRPYVTKAGVEMIDVEVEALSVGHDLTRGTSTFERATSPGRATATEEEQAPAA